MIVTAAGAATSHELPTLWGLDPIGLHDAHWLSQGVQVVRLGQGDELLPQARLFLLIEPHVLSLFDVQEALAALDHHDGEAILRLRDKRRRGFREVVLSDAQGRFVRFQRHYGQAEFRSARLAVTRDRRVARLWRDLPDAISGWRMVRALLRRHGGAPLAIASYLYNATDRQEVVTFVHRLQRSWSSPGDVIDRATQVGQGVWGDIAAEIGAGTRLVGPVWIGAGRSVASAAVVAGPAILWDDPQFINPHHEHAYPLVKRLAQPALPGPMIPVRIGPTTQHGSGEPALHRLSLLYRAVKRSVDILGALVGLALTLPLYPLVALAIVWEDGWPVFFGHRRQTLGGREFVCLKFRSMRRDAEQHKALLAGQNQADGPQFFIKHDPRLTRIGRLLRDSNIDELPQLWNVLLGHMSLVGPRPSPHKENQYCPPWREARLSVRPGITGLWQVRRSRVAGLDFQEWIRYDIEYVERAGLSLDLWILTRTVTQIVGRLFNSLRCRLNRRRG
ncbi:MAG: sugar transferase [Phycisphaeraceae bacterium]